MTKLTTVPHNRSDENDNPEDYYEYLRGESDEYETEELEREGFMLVSTFGAKKLQRLFVIVEMYDHKKYGRGKREFLSQFTHQERKLLSRWYLRIYAWYLRTGIPRGGVRMSLGTYHTLCRFADFFASL